MNTGAVGESPTMNSSNELITWSIIIVEGKLGIHPVLSRIAVFSSPRFESTLSAKNLAPVSYWIRANKSRNVNVSFIAVSKTARSNDKSVTFMMPFAMTTALILHREISQVLSPQVYTFFLKSNVIHGNLWTGWRKEETVAVVAVDGRIRDEWLARHCHEGCGIVNIEVELTSSE